MPNSVRRAGNDGFLSRAHSILVFGGGVYVLALSLLALPYFQRHLIYLHAIKFPLFPKFDTPEYYGLAPFKTLNLNLTTSDDVQLGAWFVFSDDYYKSHSSSPLRSSPFTESDIKDVLATHPIVLFFHGNAANRAAPYRVGLYSRLSTILGASVIAIDYRGFGNSDGEPSPEGLGRDARAAWDWLVQRGATPNNITIMGHSLGTGVAARFSADLIEEGVSPRALVLVAPFSSIASLTETYTLFGYIPIMRPLRTFPFIFKFFLRFLRHHFDTLSILPSIKAPILLIHADNDGTIPSSHSEVLFSALLDPLLPPSPYTPEQISRPSLLSPKDWEIIRETQSKRTEARSKVVKDWELDTFGSVQIFERPSKGKVVFVKTHIGGHVEVLLSEGVIDLIAKVAGIQLGL